MIDLRWETHGCRERESLRSAAVLTTVEGRAHALPTAGARR
jgi:hypothetical protein